MATADQTRDHSPVKTVTKGTAGLPIRPMIRRKSLSARIPVVTPTSGIISSGGDGVMNRLADFLRR